MVSGGILAAPLATEAQQAEKVVNQEGAPLHRLTTVYVGRLVGCLCKVKRASGCALAFTLPDPMAWRPRLVTAARWVSPGASTPPAQRSGNRSKPRRRLASRAYRSSRRTPSLGSWLAV